MTERGTPGEVLTLQANEVPAYCIGL